MPGERVVSLLPSATEIVTALGCADRLVGRSHECDFPPGVDRLPVCTRPRVKLTGSSLDIDRQVKEVVAGVLSVYEVLDDVLREADPDVIVTQNQCEVCAVSLPDVEAAVCNWVGRDVDIVSLEPTAMEAVYDDILRVAAALDVRDAGDRVVSGMQATVARIAERAADARARPRVACIEWADPLMAAGNWIPELVTFAGGVDPLGKPGAHSEWMTWHDLVAADPDVIVLMPCGYDLPRTCREADLLAKHPGWAALRAVRNGRVYVTDGTAFFNRPGPRLAESLEMLAEMIHPELFDFGHRGSGWQPYTTNSGS
jgi:iron complex transport system substrate-binding protein